MQKTFVFFNLLGTLVLLSLSLCLSGCGGTPNRAPVVNLKANAKHYTHNSSQKMAVMISPIRVISNSGNKQSIPYKAPISVPAPNRATVTLAKPRTAQRHGNNVAQAKTLKTPVAQKQAVLPLKQVHWAWPHKGPILRGFQASNAKGIDIGGSNGPVKASAKGTVVYSGSGLKGYGNLIIIKHDEDFLSAYAHNDKLMVKEGERVVLGQDIATIGKTDTDRVKLHFEIRYKGKPVDPLRFLPGAS